MGKQVEKVDVYKMITDRFIEELEKGIIPWKKPWKGCNGGAFNRVTKRKYSLLNQLMLLHDGEYATFKQRTDLGGKIKKGEKGEHVCFWKMYVKIEEVDGEKVRKTFPILKYHTVFHISQVENVEPLPDNDEKVKFEHDPIEKADEIFQEYIGREHIGYQNNGNVENEMNYEEVEE